MEVQPIHEYNLIQPHYWGPLNSSLAELPHFMNGRIQGLDYYDMAPSSDSGLTSYRPS